MPTVVAAFAGDAAEAVRAGSRCPGQRHQAARGWKRVDAAEADGLAWTVDPAVDHRAELWMSVAAYSVGNCRRAVACKAL